MKEHECPRCHREVELPFGELCGICKREISRRASRTANLVAVASTAVMALYTVARLPEAPAPNQRLVAYVGIIVWFMLSNMVVRRVMKNYTR